MARLKFSIRPFRRAIALSLTTGLVSCASSPPQPTADRQPVPAPTEAIAPSPAAPPANTLQVVATASVLCDLAEQIAAQTIRLTCLVKPGTDPHVYEPTPSDRRAIEDADLVLYSGYDYEPDLIQMIAATNTPAPKVAVFEQAVPTPLMGAEHDSDHGHDHGHDHKAEQAEAPDHGHNHGMEKIAPDPHIWHNPAYGAKMAQVIANQLEQLVPAHASLYQERETAIAQQLTQINAWMKTQVATVPETSRKLVTPHDSFRYFAQAFGFEVKGTIEGLSTEERPSASRMATLVDLVRDAKVPAIFGEQTTNPQLIETVARDAGVKVAAHPLFVEGPGGPDSAAPTYQKMLITNTCTIVNALGGTCDPSTAPQ